MKWLDIRFKSENQTPDVPELFNLETAKYIGPQYLDSQVWTIIYHTKTDPEQFYQDEFAFYTEYFWPEELIEDYLTDLQKLISAFMRSKEQMLLLQMDKPEEFKIKLKHLQEKELIPS